MDKLELQEKKNSAGGDRCLSGPEPLAPDLPVQNIVAHQDTASVYITFTVTFPIITRMKFGTTLQHVVSSR